MVDGSKRTCIEQGSSSWLTEDECLSILETYVAKSLEPEERKSRRLAEQLSGIELDVAAQCSYAYWVTSIRSPETLTDEIRFATAMREANRHLDGVPDFEDSLRFLKATIQFHLEKQTSIYRTCMLEDFEYDDSDDSILASKRRSRITDQMNIQTIVVRGHDKDKNGIILALPRKQSSGDDIDGFLDFLMYTIERVAASTEAVSKGHSDRLVAIVDAKNSSAPSAKASMAAINILQSHYPGRLTNLVILDPPYFLVALYNVVKPFLDPDTRSKFLVVKGAKQRESSLSVLLDASQATPNLLQNGKLGPTVDGQRFLNDVPFHCLYDNVPQENVEIKAGPSRKRVKIKVSTILVGSMTKCHRVTVEPVGA
jgi:hypothetical protein